MCNVSASDFVFPRSTNDHHYNATVFYAGCCGSLSGMAVLAIDACRNRQYGGQPCRLRRHLSKVVILSGTLACLGLTVRSALQVAPGCSVSCGTSLAVHIFIIYNYVCYFVWNLVSAAATVTRLMKVQSPDSEDDLEAELIRRRRLLALHTAIWISVAAACSIEISVELAIGVPIGSYTALGTMIMALVGLPCLYGVSILTVKRMVMTRHLSYTDSQRMLITRTKAKLVLCLLVFVICWMPTAISSLYNLLKPSDSTNQRVNSMSWITVFVVPLQPLFSSLAYTLTAVPKSVSTASPGEWPQTPGKNDSQEAQEETKRISYRRSSLRRYSTFGDDLDELDPTTAADVRSSSQ